MTFAAITEKRAEEEAAPQRPSKWVSTLSEGRVGLVIGLTALIVLTIWLGLDNTIPGFDPAWHSIYSSSVRRFLTHPAEWNLSSLLALTRQHFAYPSAGWLFNGALKVLAGDSLWGDKACLIVQAAILLVATYKAAFYTWSSKMKSNISLLMLVSLPLVSGIAHLPFLDLLHTASYASFLAGLAFWRKKKTLKASLLASVLFGFCCSCKQIAILYCGPILAFLFLHDLWKRDWKTALQSAIVAIGGPLFLLAWIIPNLGDLVVYSDSRNKIGPTILAKVWMGIRNLQLSSSEIWQGFSALIITASIPMVFAKNAQDTFRKAWLMLVPGLAGWLLLVFYAYYNIPEPRYFGPLAVSFAILMGGLIGQSLTSERRALRLTAYCCIILAPIQILLLSFAPAPMVKRPEPYEVNPIFDICGISDDLFLRTHLPCDYNKDSWKQSWIFDQIDKAENGRYVYLCVLPSSWEFNQGSMAYVSHLRKSHIIPISWRRCNPDMTDQFVPPKDINYVDWYLLKTGSQGTVPIPASEYTRIQNWVENGGDYTLVAKSDLPDHSSLKLYRKDYAAIWLRTKK